MKKPKKNVKFIKKIKFSNFLFLVKFYANI